MVPPGVELRLRLLWAHGGLNDRLKLSEIAKLDLTAVQKKVVLKDDIQSGAARELRFWPARKEHGSQSCRRADPRANAKSLHAVGNCANSRAGGCRLRDRADVFSFPTTAGDLAFGVHGFLATGIGATRGSIQTDGVTVRQYQRVKAQPEFALPFHFSRALRFQQLAAKIRTNGDHDAIILSDRKRRLKVDRVSRPGAACGNAVLKHHAYPRS